MSAKPGSEAGFVARRRALLPASIILTARELKHYRRWQLETQPYDSSATLGQLPSAVEYSAFKAWRVDQRRAAEICLPDPFRWSEELAAHISPTSELPPSLDYKTSITCDPILHTTEAVKTTADDDCYPCMISAHIIYMKALTTALSKTNGPPMPPENASLEYEQAYEAWYCGKLDILQTLRTIQDYEEVTDSAHKALSMYWRTIDNSTDSTSECDDFGGIIKRRDSAQVKRVGFTKDTNFNEGRSQAYFRKEGLRGKLARSHGSAPSGGEPGHVDGQENVALEADDDVSIMEQDAETNDIATLGGPDSGEEVEYETDSDSNLDEEDENDEHDNEDDDDEEWDTLECEDKEDGFDASFIVFGD
ncbi:hypothetical protein B0J11DRAFT_574808 [Dendryphion nanum]|uniref:Uncharacterized protein n=1 Tax=Dendryphion nanum TaxID=256645 RepID=A0A9P9EJZ0_9PLEO|nr:hypothetical protein B0J11DRAFT_574808 [Dendryphion nanum]